MESDDHLLGDRVRYGLQGGGRYPPPSGARRLALVTLGQLRQRGLRGALGEVRRRAAAPAPAPEPARLDELLAPLDPVTRDRLQGDLEALLLGAPARRLVAPGTRSRGRLLVPVRLVLQRILAPTLDAQESFNASTHAAVERLAALVASQQARIAELEERR